MKRLAFLLPITFISLIFVSSALAETTLEVTNCRGKVTEIKTSHLGVSVIFEGGGGVFVKWDKIKKIIVPNCNPKNKLDDPIPCQIFLQNGEKQDLKFTNFTNKDGKGDYYLGGSIALGNFWISRTEIKQVIVK